MIKNFEFYHGTVFTKLIHHSEKPISISRFMTSSNASYILNGSTGVYIKHSHKRLTPWHFTLSKTHQDEIFQMRGQLQEVFLLLVCGEDGIVALSYDELKEVLDEIYKPTEWISVARNKRKEYTVKGSDGVLSYKVSKHDFPRKIIESTDKAIQIIKQETKHNYSADALTIN